MSNLRINCDIPNWYSFVCDTIQHKYQIFSLNVYGGYTPNNIKKDEKLYGAYKRAVLPTLTEPEYVDGSKWLSNYLSVTYSEFSSGIALFLRNNNPFDDKPKVESKCFDKCCTPRFDGRLSPFSAEVLRTVVFYFDDFSEKDIKDLEETISFYKHDSYYLESVLVGHRWGRRQEEGDSKLSLNNWNNYRRFKNDNEKAFRDLYLRDGRLDRELFDNFDKAQNLTIVVAQTLRMNKLNELLEKASLISHNVVVFTVNTICDCQQKIDEYCEKTTSEKLFNLFVKQAERKTRVICAETAELRRIKKEQELREAEEARKRKRREREEKRERNLRSYNRVNAHACDSKVQLQSDGHATFDGMNYDYPQVLMSPYFPAYGLDNIAIDESRRRDISVSEVKKEWSQKAQETKRREMDLFEKIDRYFQGYQVELDNVFSHFDEFHKKTGVWPYRTRWTIYDDDAKIAAVADFVEKSSDGFIVYKIKSSDNILDNGIPKKVDTRMGMALPPLLHLGNTLYYKCALELNIIKYILEKNYGMRVVELRLGVFHPSYFKPYVLRMPDLQTEVNSILSARSDIIF